MVNVTMNTQAMLVDSNTVQNVGNSSIEQFVVQAKRTNTEEELLKVIHNCLESPGIYVFGELLELPAVRNVSCTYLQLARFDH